MFPADPLHRRAQLLVLLLFACVRLGHLAQLVDSPALAQQQWPDSDMFAFDQWAQHIAHGDLLSRQPQRPLTGWQRDVAAQWRQLRPDDPLARQPSDAAAQALWQNWQGGARFYQEPLFPYLLAGWYALVGPSPLLAFALQALLGLLGLWLLMDATRRLIGVRVAILSGLLATLCGPLAYYESLLLRETLAVTTVWLLVRQWAVARAAVQWRAYAGLGLAAGLAVLTRAAIAPFVLALALASLWPRPTRLARLAGWLAGLAVPLGLLALRNGLVGVPPLALAGGGVFAFAAANAPGADPWQGLVLDAPVIARLLVQSGGAPLALAWATLQAQPHLLALEFTKLAALLHNFEIPNNSSFAFYRQHAPILWLLLIDFAVVLPLGLVGAVQAVRQRRARSLVVLAAVQILPLLLLQPLSRYRLGLLAALLPLAALGIDGLHQLWLERRALALAWLVPVALLTAVLFRPLPDAVAPTRAVDHAVAWQFWALPQLRRAAEQQDHAGVAAAMACYLRGEPSDLADWPRAVRTDQVRIAERYSEAHAIAAQALELQGLAAEAAQHRAASARLHAKMP